MYKKAFLLAILVLGASAASIEGKAKKDIIAKVKAHYNVHHAKREPGTCVALECRDRGDKCDLNTTACARPYSCRDGICRLPAAGDHCEEYDECYNEENDNLYCDDTTNKCKAYDKVGDPCESECNYKHGGTPLICDAATKKCKADEANPGEPCGDNTVCLGGSVCYITPSESTCVIYPGTVGAECNTTTVGCDSRKYLYCDGETSKCVEFPKEGKECYRGYYCNKDFYCNGTTCNAKKGLNEECTFDSECKDGFTCYDGKCRSENPKKGEYCNEYSIRCETGYMCADNVCVEWDGTCKYDDDCQGTFEICDNGKCKGDMGIADGEKCVLDIDEDFDYIFASAQCKEGLGCVPNAHGETEGTCKKITAKGGETCESDEDCPADAFCRCNDKDGKMQCIPIPTSTKELYEKAAKFENAEDTCDDKDFETEEEADKCYYNEIKEFYDYIQNHFDYSSEYRCVDISALVGAASSVKVSVVAMAAALLLALFF